MSWLKSDNLCSRFKSIFNKNVPKGLICVGSNLVTSRQLYWENGQHRPSRPSHTKRLIQFRASEKNAPLILLRGNAEGYIDIFSMMHTKDVIGLCVSQQLAVLKPEPDPSSMRYGCLMRKQTIEGVTYAAEVLSSALKKGYMNFGELKV